MPWKLTYKTRTAFLYDEPVETDVSRSEPWVNDQIVAAREAVSAILKAGVAGSESYHVKVELEGNGRRRHRPLKDILAEIGQAPVSPLSNPPPGPPGPPQAEEAPDFISIKISQLTAAEVQAILDAAEPAPVG
jgi:hypothetical protein